jgi:2-polyprenyl-6-hydroxyphenyl methylase / 3-demethylubiquinone-9 3-methyltransferase
MMDISPYIDKRLDIQSQIKDFYDKFWPSNLPTIADLDVTRSHLKWIIPDKIWKRALDAGCGLGVCSVALSEMCENVVGLDISHHSLREAARLARDVNRTNTAFVQGSLMDVPYDDEAFDIILCWGVLMYVPSVARVFGELVRTLRKGGTLVIAVHRKTALAPLHDVIRRMCLRVPEPAKGPLIKTAALPIKIAAAVVGRQATRDDLPIEAKIDDFYFIPFKRFFSIAEIQRLFAGHGLSSEVLYEYTGRFKSSSSFIVRGTKQTMCSVFLYMLSNELLKVLLPQLSSYA